MPAPSGPQPVDGISLVPVLKDAAARVRDHAYHAYPKQKLGCAVRTERYRLVEWRAVGKPAETAEYELYDYESDPQETRNLAADNPDVVSALKEILARYPKPLPRTRKKTPNRKTSAKESKPDSLAAGSVSDQEVVDQWRYTLRRPAEGWRQPDFDDTDWQKGFGGFGTRNTPGSRVGTVWATNSIWLRKTIDLKEPPKNPALLIHHDDNVEIYLNGKGAIVLKGFTKDYKIVPIPEGKHSLIKSGRNMLAVHCSQKSGGQFIDVHLIDADNVPKLPEPKRSAKPFVSDLITKWGHDVTSENAWTEYPRPQLKRENWHNLNGHWNYAVTSIEQKEAPSEWDGKILVPYALESKLSGVQRLLDATEAMWYHRSFHAEKSSQKRLVLNFEAVDYHCEVFVNGLSVGTHIGGNTPFSFDITEAINDGGK